MEIRPGSIPTPGSDPERTGHDSAHNTDPANPGEGTPRTDSDPNMPAPAGSNVDPAQSDSQSGWPNRDPDVPRQAPSRPGDPGRYSSPFGSESGTPLGAPVPHGGSVLPALAPAAPRVPRPSGRPTPPPHTPNPNNTPSQPPKRRWGRVALALGVTAAVLGGGAVYEHKTGNISEAVSTATNEVGSWFTDDEHEETKPEQEANPGGPIFAPNQEKSNELFAGKNVYDWANGFNLTADNTDQAKQHMYEVAYYDAGVAAAQLATAGFDGMDGVNAAPEEHEFASDTEFQAAVLGYEDYLRGNTDAAEKALKWLKDDYLAKANVHVEYHSGNYKTWGKDANGKVYIEDSAWGDSAVLVCEKDGEKTFYRADCGWQPYEEIAVQVTYASPTVFQPAAATSIPAAEQGGGGNTVYAVQWGPETNVDTPPPTTDNPGDTPPPSSPPPSSPPPTSPPPTSPPPTELLPKSGPDANALLSDAQNRLGELAGNVQSGLPKTAVDPPAKYDAPAAPKPFSGTIPGADSNPRSSSPGGGGASVPSVDPGLRGGTTPQSGTTNLD